MSFIQISHYMIITVWLFISPFIFKFSFWCMQTVYIAYEHCISLEFYWNMTYWHMLPGYSTFHQVYIRYIQHIMEIPTYHWINIMRMVLRGIPISVHFITVWLHPDVYPFYCIYSLYTVYTLCWHSHIGFTYTKRIHLVYLWYISLHKKVHSVYNMYTSGFIFLDCIYDHRTFMLFQV